MDSSWVNLFILQRRIERGAVREKRGEREWDWEERVSSLSLSYHS